MNNSIATIQVIGDIHSGTRWIHSLINENIFSQDIQCIDDNKHEYFSTSQPKKNFLYIYPIRTYKSWLPRMKVINYGYYQNIEDLTIYHKYSNRALSNLEILQGFNFICGRLDVLQKDQGRQLLTKISDAFNISVCPSFRPITKHTKSHTQWWKIANKSSQPNYNFDYCNNNLFESLLNKLQSELLFNVSC